MNRDYFIRLFAIVLAGVTPISIALLYPDLDSLSQCWDTPLQPLFIISNYVTSYLFFSLNRWVYPGVFLLLLTAFSHSGFPIFHNLLAVCFFFSSVWALWYVKRFPIYYWIFCFSLISMFFSLMWGEVIGIVTLCVYHFHLLSYKKKFYTRNL